MQVSAINLLGVAAANGSDSHSADATTAIIANKWYHFGGTWDGSNNRRAYMNGVLETTANALRTPVGVDNTTIGSGGGNGDYNPWQGIMSDVALWSVVLTDAEMRALAAGMSPLKVRPASLLAYWPMIAGNSPEPDPRGINPLTLVGASTQGSSGPVKRRHRR